MHQNSLVEEQLLEESQSQRKVLDELRSEDIYQMHRHTSRFSPTLEPPPIVDSQRKIVLVDIDDDIDLERVEALQELELHEGTLGLQ